MGYTEFDSYGNVTRLDREEFNINDGALGYDESGNVRSVNYNDFTKIGGKYSVVEYDNIGNELLRLDYQFKLVNGERVYYQATVAHNNYCGDSLIHSVKLYFSLKDDLSIGAIDADGNPTIDHLIPLTDPDYVATQPINIILMKRETRQYQYMSFEPTIRYT